MADKVLIAKRDIYAEIDNGFGTKVRQLVAREGQEVPPALADHVDSGDVTSELPKTRSLGGRSASDRRAQVDADVEAPDHAEVRAAAALQEPEESADLPVEVGGDQEVEKQADERVAEAEKKAEEAIAEAQAAAETREEEPVKDQSKAKARANDGAKAKARKSAPNKARKGAKSK